MISKLEFENLLTQNDVVEAFNASMDSMEQMLGFEAQRMVGFSQQNCHHCYDLFMHTLKTVEGINPQDLTQEQFLLLRVAAFFHDIGKPEVAKFNEKTKQQVFYGHSVKSAEVSERVLTELGYSSEQIQQLQFLIAHHDDFISYKASLAPYMQNHMFIREITPSTVAEKILENKYDFAKMGYSEEEIKGILVNLVYNKTPFFKTKDNNYSFNVDMQQVKQKMASGQFLKDYVPSLEDYQLLLKLCKADAGAQQEIVVQDGKVVDSKKDKIFRLGKVEDVLAQSYDLVESISKNCTSQHSKN